MSERTHHTWMYIILWVIHMAKRYGGIVWDKSGDKWDWGQAICREMYGPRWMHHPDFQAADGQSASDRAPDDMVQRAREWRKGEWPEWVDKDKMLDNRVLEAA